MITATVTRELNLAGSMIYIISALQDAMQDAM